MGYKEVRPDEASRQLATEVVRAWRAKRDERLFKQKEVNALQNQETEMKSWLIEVFRQQAMEGILVDAKTTGLSSRAVYTVTDRPTLQDYILETESLDLLQFRVNQAAIAERGGVPGVETVEIYDLFDRKI